MKGEDHIDDKVTLIRVLRDFLESKTPRWKAQHLDGLMELGDVTLNTYVFDWTGKSDVREWVDWAAADEVDWRRFRAKVGALKAADAAAGVERDENAVAWVAKLRNGANSGAVEMLSWRDLREQFSQSAVPVYTEQDMLWSG